MLAEAVPKLRTILFVSTAAAWDSPGARKTREAAQKLEISLISAPVSIPVDEEALKRTFGTITPGQADGIMFAYEPELLSHRLLIVELVRQTRIQRSTTYGSRRKRAALSPIQMT
jgi:hypothetical protein